MWVVLWSCGFLFSEAEFFHFGKGDGADLAVRGKPRAALELFGPRRGVFAEQGAQNVVCPSAQGLCIGGENIEPKAVYFLNVLF